jgi:RND family efflux transporter MFP subunit
MLRRQLLPVLLVCGAAVAGCNQGPPPMPPMAPPDVEVEPAVEQTVTEYEVFYGKTAAEKEVDVRAHVSGYLDKILFKDGAEVRANDVLFQIDPRPLEAELERTEAMVAVAEAHLQRLEYDYGRASRLLASKGMSREDYDKAAGDLAEARATLKASRAARNTAKLNLDYSHVTAPVSGRISRRFIDIGNMIKADDTSLTRIECLDPMYVYFDIDERTFERVQDFLEQAQASPGSRKLVPVAMGLSKNKDAGEAAEGRPALDDRNFPYLGEVDFVDNRVDPDSGSIWVRGTFKNADRKLTPGLFARVRLPVSVPHKAVLIPEQAVATDQGQKFVWVVVDGVNKEGHKESHAFYRQLQFGPQHGRQRVVEKGIKPGDRVIISGLQRVRAGQEGYAVVNVLPKKPDAPAPRQDAKKAAAE